MSVLANRTLLFAAKRMRDYRKSNFGILLGVVSTVLLWLATALTFAAINLAIFKASPPAFIAEHNPTFFTFFHHSFKALLFTSIDELRPAMALSQSITMAENFCAITIGLIFASILVSVRGQQYTEQLDELIGRLEHEGAQIETLIRNRFKLNSIDDAIAELTRLQAGALQLFFSLPGTLTSTEACGTSVGAEACPAAALYQ